MSPDMLRKAAQAVENVVPDGHASNPKYNIDPKTIARTERDLEDCTGYIEEDKPEGVILDGFFTLTHLKAIVDRLELIQEGKQ